MFEGHGALVALDHDEPAVADHVIAVLRHWLDRGADGWRLDAAYAVSVRSGAGCATRSGRAIPTPYLYGEAVHGGSAELVADSGLDSVTQYELWKAVRSALNETDPHELSHALGRHAAMLESFVPMTFIGSHDVTRIASKLTDPQHLQHAVVLLATLPGHPIVYAGDEVGATGVKEERVGGDEAVRPAFASQPEEPEGLAAEVWALHRRLIALRRRHPWLVDGRLEVQETGDEHLVYRVSRRDGGPGHLEVLLDLADEPARPRAGVLVEGSADPRAAGIWAG